MLRFLRFLARLPLRSLYRILACVSTVLYDVVRWRRELTLRNLRNAFPERPEEEIRSIARASYRNLGDVIAETLKGNALSAEEIRERVRLVNPELVAGILARGQSALVLASHQCNWEWLLLASGATLGIPVDAVYKPQQPDAIDRFLLETRSKFGGNPIQHKVFVRQVLRLRRQARLYAMVADQTPLRSDEKHWTRFLNQDTAFFVGPGLIARAASAAVVFVDMRRLRRGYYEVRFELLAEPPYGKDTGHIIERYARRMETQIVANPSDWLWLHRKWKYRKSAAEAATA